MSYMFQFFALKKDWWNFAAVVLLLTLLLLLLLLLLLSSSLWRYLCCFRCFRLYGFCIAFDFLRVVSLFRCWIWNQTLDSFESKVIFFVISNISDGQINHIWTKIAWTSSNEMFPSLIFFQGHDLLAFRTLFTSGLSKNTRQVQKQWQPTSHFWYSLKFKQTIDIGQIITWKFTQEKSYLITWI